MERYKVVRIYRNSNYKRTIETGLTLEEAQKLVMTEEDNARTMLVFYKQ